jgi:glyoxylase-like metal-dependent hydrolase (beta-lactamase superfamily II)
VRVLALHEDVIVFVSRVWQTTCTAVRAGEEGFVIDSPVYPDELEAVPSVLEQAGFPVSGLLATHADWDHLLGRLAYPDLALGCGRVTAERLQSEPGAAQRGLRQFDEEQYVERPRPLGLGRVQELPVPGKLSIGPDRELELHPAGGHTADGMSIVMPWAGVLVCGDYVSPVEIPMISAGGSLAAYLQTLRTLRRLTDRVETVVPGHGMPLRVAAAVTVLDEDVRYLESLVHAPEQTKLPAGRRTVHQARIHDDNLRLLHAH